MIKALILAIVLAWPGAVFAEMKAGEFVGLLESHKKAGNVNDVFWVLQLMSHQQIGMSWSNTRLEVSGRVALYCPPRKLVVKKEITYSIFKDYLRRHPRFLNIPFGGVLLNAMIEKYPCR